MQQGFNFHKVHKTFKVAISKIQLAHYEHNISTWRVCWDLQLWKLTLPSVLLTQHSNVSLSSDYILDWCLKIVYHVNMKSLRVNERLQSIKSICCNKRSPPNLPPTHPRFSQHLHCLLSCQQHWTTCQHRREWVHQLNEIQCSFIRSSWLRPATRGRRSPQTSLCLKKQVSVTPLGYMKPLNGKPPVTVYMIYLASSRGD